MTRQAQPSKSLTHARTTTLIITGAQFLSFLLLTFSGVDGSPTILSSYFVGSILVVLLFGLLPVGLGFAVFLLSRKSRAWIVGLGCVVIFGVEIAFLVASAIVSNVR